MNFTVSYNFKNLNEAIEQLPYARVYQSPVQRKNYFNIEVTDKHGGNYDCLKKLIELAKNNGFKYDSYYEMGGLFGDYNYTAIMYVEDGKTVRCSYDQNSVYIKD